MEFNDVKILYVCNDFPFPPMHGGLVDMWNRIEALHRLGVTVDLVVTVKEEPPQSALKEVSRKVRSVHILTKARLRAGILHWEPVQVAIRRGLRKVALHAEYDAVLLQSEFVTEILKNPTIRWGQSIIRVDNDEYAYQIESARAEPSLLRRLYFLQEALRVRMFSYAAFRKVDALWFVSHDDLEKFTSARGSGNRPAIHFMPTAVNLRLLDRSPHLGSRVLFVGNLWNPLNRAAVEWYLSNVHRLLDDFPGYVFRIAGSARGKPLDWLHELTGQQKNIELIVDAEDLTPVYAESTVFVNPMQYGAGVKLKTVEAGIRGLPIVSTFIGAEGTGMQPDVHYRLATSASEFARGIRDLIHHREQATSLVRECQTYLMEQYDAEKALRRALASVVQQ
jgi:polysaccharide biosynthesis protein PslH